MAPEETVEETTMATTIFNSTFAFEQSVHLSRRLQQQQLSSFLGTDLPSPPRGNGSQRVSTARQLGASPSSASRCIVVPFIIVLSNVQLVNIICIINRISIFFNRLSRSFRDSHDYLGPQGNERRVGYSERRAPLSQGRVIGATGVGTRRRTFSGSSLGMGHSTDHLRSRTGSGGSGEEVLSSYYSPSTSSSARRRMENTGLRFPDICPSASVGDDGNDRADDFFTRNRRYERGHGGVPLNQKPSSEIGREYGRDRKNAKLKAGSSQSVGLSRFKVYDEDDASLDADTTRRMLFS